MVADASEGTGTCSLGKGGGRIQKGLKSHRTGSLEVFGNLHYLHKLLHAHRVPYDCVFPPFLLYSLSERSATRGEAIHESL